MIVMQADNLSLDAADMLPLLLKGAPRNARAAQGDALLGRWNRFMLANRAEPLIYTAWIWRTAARPAGRRAGRGSLPVDGPAPDVPLMMRIIARQAGLVRRRRHAPDRDLRGRRSRSRSIGRSTGSRAARARTWTNGSGASEHLAAHRHPLFDGVPLLRDTRLGALPLRRRRRRRSTAPSRSYRGSRAVRGHARRRLSRRLRFQRPRQQPLRHAARPVGQHAVALGPQLRRALAEA